MTHDLSDMHDGSPVRVGRQGLPGARSPFPLVEHIPAQLSEDPMICAFLDALDEVWAPVITTLDCFDAYLDPHLAPPDMVAYLGSWVLALMDDTQDEEQLRADVAQAHVVAAWSGTEQILHSRLVPRDAAAIDVRDPGGIVISTTSTDPSAWQDPDDPRVVITVTSPRVAGAQGQERLTGIIRDLVPAHVILDVQVA